MQIVRHHNQIDPGWLCRRPRGMYAAIRPVISLCSRRPVDTFTTKHGVREAYLSTSSMDRSNPAQHTKRWLRFAATCSPHVNIIHLCTTRTFKMLDSKLDPTSEGHVEIGQEPAQQPGPTDPDHGGPSDERARAGPHAVPGRHVVIVHRRSLSAMPTSRRCCIPGSLGCR